MMRRNRTVTPALLDWINTVTNVYNALNLPNGMKQCNQGFSPTFCLFCCSTKHDTAFCGFHCKYCGGTTHTLRNCPMIARQTFTDFNNVDTWEKYAIAATHDLTHPACVLALPDTIEK